MASHKHAVQFGGTPYEMAAAGRYKDLTHAESLVLLLITAHTNHKFEARPSVPRLAELSGFLERSVTRAITGLEQKGLLSTGGRRGGRGVATTYRLTTNPDPTVRVSDPKPRPRSQGLDKKPRPVAPKTPTRESINPDPGVGPTALNSGERREQRATPATAPAVVVGSGKDQENNNGGQEGENKNDQEAIDRRQALVDIGVVGSKLESLSATRLTPETILKTDREIRAKDGGTGLVIDALKGLAARTDAAATKNARAAEADAAAEPRRQAYLTIKAGFEPQSDAAKVWYLRQLPRQPHHHTEFDFVASHPLCLHWSEDRHAAACEVINTALLAHPDAAKLLNPAEIEAEQPSLRLAEDGVA